jgi:hypothetical protein
MSQVAMCSSGKFLGLGAADGRIYARDDVNDDTPAGSGWTPFEVSEQFQQISCGYRDMVVAVAGGKAYYRTGYTADTMLGQGWEEFSNDGLEDDDQTFTHISVGDDGKIWAVVDENVYARMGSFPQGDSWKLIIGGRMKQVEVGRT